MFGLEGRGASICMPLHHYVLTQEERMEGMLGNLEKTLHPMILYHFNVVHLDLPPQ